MQGLVCVLVQGVGRVQGLGRLCCIVSHKAHSIVFLWDTGASKPTRAGKRHAAADMQLGLACLSLATSLARASPSWKNSWWAPLERRCSTCVAPVDAAKCGICPRTKRAYARGTVAAVAAATLTAKGGGALPWRHDRSLDYYSRITYCK